MTDALPLPPHYPTTGARAADLTVHLVGLVFAVVGGLVLLCLARGSEIAATATYAVGFVLMIACSLLYNFAAERHRALWRRFDHAGIFVMIAGSYTPFTTHVLTGWWAWGMTGAVWTIAAVGILGKLMRVKLPEWLWIAYYLSFGWLVVVAAKPIISGLVLPALILLVLGGIIYSVGIIVHVTERFPYWRCVWHIHVVAGAAAHWAAILIGTVLVHAG